MSDDTRPAAFLDFGPEKFPFAIEFFTGQGRIVASYIVEGPSAIDIPALAERHGPVGARLIFADGRRVEAPPPIR